MLFPSKIDRSFASFCRTGDLAALGEVFDATAADLLRLAMYVCRDLESARDAVQETFVAAIESRHRYQARERAMPWLLGILTNQARHARRLAHRRIPVVEQRSDDPARIASEHELQHRLAALTADLGEPYESVLRLHLDEGLNAKEIAERLSRPAGTVRTQLMRALGKVREHLPTSFVASALALVVARPSAAATATLAGVRDFVLATARDATKDAATSTADSVTVTTGGAKAGLVAGLAFFVTVVAAFVWWPRDGVAPRPALSTTGANAPLADATPMAATREPAVTVLPPLELLPAEPGVAALRVRVRWDHDGSPAEGVTVIASNGRVLTQRDAVTGPDGIADLRQVTPGEWTVEADCNERSAERSVTVKLEDAGSTALDLLATYTGVDRGIVVDEAGAPIEDASIVRVVQDCWVNEVARSGPDGTFSVARSLGASKIGVRKEGFAPSRIVELSDGSYADVEADEMAADARFVLRRPGASVEGTVVRGDGSPVAGALVLFGDGDEGDTRAIDARTDRAGRFRFSGLQVGWHAVRVRAVGLAFGDLIHVAVGSQVLPPIVVQETGAVRGVVRDRDGHAVKCAVCWGDPYEVESEVEPLTYRGTHTDEFGCFELLDVPAGRQVLSFGYPTSLRRTVDLEPGRVATLDVVVGGDTHWTLSGRILMTTGVAVPGLRVEAWDDVYLAPAKTIYEEPDTGRDGVIEWRGVTGRVRMSVYVQDCLLLFREFHAASAPFEILLHPNQLPSAGVRGRLVDARGEAARGWVWCDHGQQGISATLDTEGAFVFTSLPPGTQRIYHSATGGWDNRQLVATLNLGASVEWDLGTLVVPDHGGFTASVTFEGRPVAGGLVRLVRAEGDTWGGVPIEDGSANASLPQGRYRLMVGQLGTQAAQEIDVVAGAMVHVGLELRRTLAAKVVLAMADSEVNHIWWATLIARREDGGFAGQFTAELVDGSQSFAVELPAGRYDLSVTAADGWRGTGVLDLRKSGASVTLPLRPR